MTFPEAWRKYTLDWRGRDTPRPVDVDADAPARLQALLDEAADDLEPWPGLLEHTAYAAPTRVGLAGEPDPLGSALALMLLARVRPRQQALIYDTGRDAWIIRHGIAFAARTTVELLGHRMHLGQTLVSGQLEIQISPMQIGGLVRLNDLMRRMAPLRSLLAGLPDAEHAEALTEIEGHRDTEAKRFLSAMLMPEQEAWVLEACGLYAGQWRAEFGGDLFCSIASKPEHLELSGVHALDPYRGGVDQVVRLVDALGVDALPVLVNTLESDEKPTVEVRERIFEVMSRLPSDAAIAYLFKDPTNPLTTAPARAAAERFPTRVMRAIAAIAPTVTGSSKARLGGITRSDPLLTAATSNLSIEERSAIEELLRSTDRYPVAAAVPQVFATPLWSKFAKRSAKRTLTGLVPPPISELRWAPGEQDEWRKGPESKPYWARPAVLERLAHGGMNATHELFGGFLAFAADEWAAPAFDRWDGSAREMSTATVKVILARYGEPAADRVFELIKKKPSLRPAMSPFVNLDAARMAADWLRRSRADRATAKSWLDRHATDAAALLVPDALGMAAKPRQVAAEALRYLAVSNREIVEAQAGQYGETAVEAVKALLDTDPLDPQVARIPKPGAWADPAMLPPVLLDGREAALPAEATRTLMTALALDDPERLYAGADLLVAECDPASLTAFSWGLFELWVGAGSPSKDAWAMDQLRRFADDDTVRNLTMLIRAWPGQSQSRKAVRGLEILGGIGSEAALRAVQDISTKVKFKALKKTAAEQIEAIADRLELSTDQLADRLVPDFGLAGESEIVLDYGPRTFTVKFDERLRPFVVDGSGKRRANLPKPGAEDDLELARPAYERFAALRRDLKTTAVDQVKRLEQAMAASRMWTCAEFRRYLVDHPLIWHLSSRLIWQADTDQGWRAFRLAEDRTFADVDDETLTLSENTIIRIAHPLTLGDELAEWAETLADYEILQPFEQLARPAFTVTDKERETGRLARFEGAVVGSGPLVGLLKRGWNYGDPQRGHHGSGVYFELPGDGYVLIDPRPGIYPGPDPGGDQNLEVVAIKLPDEGNPVDPVLISEVLRIIAKLARTA